MIAARPNLTTRTVIRAPFDLDIASCAKYAIAAFGSFNNRREGAGEIRGPLSHLIRYQRIIIKVILIDPIFGIARA
jgi:hypothetical protein